MQNSSKLHIIGHNIFELKEDLIENIIKNALDVIPYDAITLYRTIQSMMF